MLEYGELIDYFRAGCKDEDHLFVGLEWERFSLNAETGEPLPYHGPVSVFAILNGLIAEYGWTPEFEGENIIALHRKRADGHVQAISLEPGGQIELSGALHRDVAGVRRETEEFDRELTDIGDKVGVKFLAVGFIPDKKREDFHWVPKNRYQIMRDYMPKRGSLGLDMMLRTCTAQVNLDYTSEADMVDKMRVSAALQPLATALFANSRLVEGEESGYVSYRSHVWEDVDPDRTGVLSFIFDPDFGFARYAEYALSVPMYFVKRDGNYIDVAGRSFKDFMAGALPELPGETPTIKDWEDHLSTLFPEVRLKKFLEMRGADSVPIDRVVGLADLWCGLLYDKASLERAKARIAAWTAADVARMRVEAPKHGMNTLTPEGGTFADLAVELRINPDLYAHALKAA